MAVLRLTLVVVGLVAVAPRAYANTDLLVTAPAKWRLDREKSAQINIASQASQHFGTAPSIDVTEAYFPIEIGAALIVTRSTTTALPGGRDLAIAAAVSELEGWAARSDSPTSPITDRTASRDLLEGGKLIEIQVGGRDGSASTRQKFHMIVAADATKVVTTTGLCLDRDDSNADDIAACRAALATLQTGVAAADRATLVLPAAAAPATPTPAPAPAATPTTTAPAMSDGTKVKIGPITIPQDEPSSDRRPIYLGLGLVVLAAIFWWNRRQRDRFDDEDRAVPRRSRRPDADEDADDLHAAARGDGGDGGDEPGDPKSAVQPGTGPDKQA